MTPRSETSDTNWQLETLFKNALIRTKDRFLPFFLSMIIVWGAFIGTFIVFGLVGGGLGAAIYFSHNQALLGVLIAVMMLLLAVVMFYIIAWWGLTVVEIVIQKNKTDVMGAFRKVRPVVWGYVGVQGLFWLFLIGLVPFMVLSVGVVGLLWAIWSAFIAFAYLETGKRGLDVVWYSRTLVNQKFWPVVGRIVIVIVLLIVVQLLLGFAHNSVLHLFSTLVSFIATPFILSYYYEIYSNLEQSVEEKKPIGWIVASVVGWLLIATFLVTTFTYAITNLPTLLKDIYQNSSHQYKYKNIPVSPTIPDTGNTQGSYQL